MCGKGAYEATMNNFEQEIYIRLTDNSAAFVSTVKRGELHAEETEITLESQVRIEDLDEKALVLMKKRPLRRIEPDSH
jgi:hypothetical protein